MSSEAITKNDLAEILSKIPMATSENLPGIIKMFAGTFAPTGWLLCDGAEVAIEDYPALYDVIQDTYGTASDSDHFVLPDFRGRSPLGAGIGTASDATLRTLGQEGGSERVTLTANQSGVPAHAHTINHTHTFTRPTNAIYLKKLAASGSATWTPTPQSSSTGHYSDSVVLSGGSVGQHTGNSGNNTASGASESHGNMSPYLTVNYIISTGGVSRWSDSAGLPIVRDVTVNGQTVVSNEIAEVAKTIVLNPTYTNTTGNIQILFARQSGKVVWLSVAVNNSAAVSAGANIYNGQLSGMPFPPRIICNGSYYGSTSIGGSLGADGQLIVRNASPSAVTISGTNNVSVSFCYVIN